MQPVYKVPVVPNNLRHKETIIQIADALNYVSQVFDDILLRVNKSISEKQNQVTQLKGRITIVHQKVVKLTQTKKATQVFSNSKYPVSNMNDRYKSIFSIKDKETAQTMLKRIKFKLKDPMLNEQQTNVLQFYHVKIKNYLNGPRNASLEGLGQFPSNAQLVNELLLFNTYKNPYKKYEMSDPLSNQMDDHKRAVETDQTGLDAAPLSMTQRSGAVQAYKEDYFYSPDLGEVPTIDVPLDLPDLPGVADDLRYLMEIDPVIAPSIQTTPIIPELPSIAPKPPEIQSLEVKNKNTTSAIKVPEEIQSPSSFDLPELPSPKVEVTVAEVSLPELPLESPVVTSRSVEVEMDKPAPKVDKPSSDVSAEARASLMEAIRQGGTLRKTPSKINNNKEDSKPAKEVRRRFIYYCI